jgi:hypothetical protein
MLSRSPTPATLRFATTAALAAVTHVARHLVLHARVRPLARTPLAAPAALVALFLPRLFLSTPTGATKASTRNTTPSQYHTPKSPPPTTTPRDFFVYLSCYRERTGIFLRRALHVEGCCFASVFLCVFFSVSQGWINFFLPPDGLRHLFGDHNPSSIRISCVIYDLEGINDANPQDANLTLTGEIYFP